MLHSLILMFSQYRESKICVKIFRIVWIVCAILSSVFSNNLIFFVVNLSVFFLITLFIKKNSKFFPKLNMFLSTFSILLYSLFVDLICYYLFPLWGQEITLFQYIINGLVFNFKYVVTNMITHIILNLKIFKKGTNINQCYKKQLQSL